MDPYEEQPLAGPNGHRARSLAWILACLLSLILLVPAMALYTFSIQWLATQGIRLEQGLVQLLGLCVFAGVLLSVGKITSKVMDRRYPNTPIRSANWEDSPGMMRK